MIYKYLSRLTGQLGPRANEQNKHGGSCRTAEEGEIIVGVVFMIITIIVFRITKRIAHNILMPQVALAGKYMAHLEV